MWTSWAYPGEGLGVKSPYFLKTNTVIIGKSKSKNKVMMKRYLKNWNALSKKNPGYASAQHLLELKF